MMTQRPRILVLGAGQYQVRLIRCARSLGFEVHVVSYAGDFPGIPMADRFHDVDTTDIAGVVKVARNIKARAVVTAGTDVCVPTIGAVCESLGLPGLTKGTADTISRKDLFRALQEAHGLNAPRFRVVDGREELPAALYSLEAPLLLKPVDSSGSRGIVRLEERNERAAVEAYDHARRYSRCGRVCVEEALNGVEVGGNAMMHDGKIAFLAITAKHMSGFLVRGHSYPTNIEVCQQEALRREIDRTCAALNYRDGALNFDVILDRNHATIIELGARLGGNGLTDLIFHAFSYDIESDVIRLALGEKPLRAPERGIRPCGSVVLGATRKGRLSRMTTAEELRTRVPEVYDLHVVKSVGSTVEPFIHNANMVGYALFSIPSGESWRSMARRIEESFAIGVESCT